jgi:ABC-type dipeptide/oligopeptide/nickel transport system, ATPase component
MPSTSPLLSIENLNTSFHTDDGVIRAVRGIDLQIHQGETIAIVGESGCGNQLQH